MHPLPQTTGDLKRTAAAVMPPVAFWSLRLVETEEQVLRVRQGVLQPPSYRSTSGIFVSVIDGRGMGYAATPDITPAGLRAAAGQAREWARRVGSLGITGLGLTHPGPVAGAPFSLAYRSPVESPWQRAPLAETIGILHDAARRLKCHVRIVDWEAGLPCARRARSWSRAQAARSSSASATSRPISWRSPTTATSASAAASALIAGARVASKCSKDWGSRASRAESPKRP
jgi:microcin-processing metallopeptidase PmbA/TldD-like protein